MSCTRASFTFSDNPQHILRVPNISKKFVCSKRSREREREIERVRENERARESSSTVGAC